MLINHSWRVITLALFAVAGVSACSGGGGRGGGDGAGGGATTPQVSVSAMPQDEGDSGSQDIVFTITLDTASTNTVSVDFATEDDSAIAGEDYAASSGTVSIAAGSTSATVPVSVTGDTVVESDESFQLVLSNPANATLNVDEASATIVNDDFPQLSITPAEVTEGDNGTSQLAFAVSLDQAAIGDVTVDYATSNITAEAGSDYEATTTTLVIPQGDLNASVVIAVNGDVDPEPDETLNLDLSNLSLNAEFSGPTSAFGTIRTDELPMATINSSAIIAEGDTNLLMEMFVNLTPATIGPVVLGYQTVESGSAGEGVDYIPVNDSVVINEGETRASIFVEIVGDTEVEVDENFSVELTSIAGHAELSATAYSLNATIIDNDTLPGDLPQLSIRNASVREGADGATTAMQFRAFLSQSVQTDVTFDFTTETVSGGAFGGVDFVEESDVGVTIPVGQLFTNFEITVNGDDVIEPDEQFNLLFSNASTNVQLVTPQAIGVIFDDDDPNATLPRLNITSASVVEGDDDFTNMVFTVSLSEATSSDVTFDFETSDFAVQPEALAGSDYLPISGNHFINQGETETNLIVPVIGDTVIENDEDFQLRLSNISGDAVLGNSVVFGSIISDEPFSFLSVTSNGITEGDTGDVNSIDFAINLNVASSADVTFDYLTEDRTATALDNDYVALPLSSMTIPSGETQATISVDVIGDDVEEIDEQFALVLSNISQNAEFSNQFNVGTIANDDNAFGWSLPQLLDPTGETGEGTLPRLAINDAGEAMVTWRKYEIGSSDNHNPTVRYSASGGWGPVERPAGSSSLLNFDVTMDGNNESLLLYSFAGPVTERNVSPVGWGATNRHVDAIEAVHPELHSFYEYFAIGENEAGHVTLVASVNGFASNTSGTAVRNYVPDSGWETPFLLGPNQTFINPVVDVDGQGNAILVRTGGSTAWHYDISTGTWTESPPITRPQFSSFYTMQNPKIAVAANGDAIAVWRSTFNVVANHYDAQIGLWSGPIILDPTGGIGDRESDNPQVAITDEGHGVVIFLENAAPGSGFLWKIMSRNYDAINGWAADNEEVANPELQSRQIVVDGITLLNNVDEPKIGYGNGGEPIAIWSEDIDADGIHTIRASIYHNGWGAGQILSDDAMGDANLANIGVDGTGDAIVVWQQLDPSDGEYKTWGIRYQRPN